MARAWQWIAATALVAVWASAVWSQTPAPAPPGGGFRLPVDCQLNEDCWIANYFDVVAGPAEADFRCSSRTYDGHDGVDIAVRDRKAMERGVAVLSGAPGVVAFTRDGEVDGAFAREGPQATRGLDCGNAVVVDYGGGWNAQFCHLRRGSLRVRTGERVDSSTVLGLVGMSGKAAFPHLHWMIRRDRTNLDPFTGRPAAGACAAAAGARPLWHPGAGIAYEPFNLYAAGFAASQPSPADIIDDAEGPAELPRDSRAIGLWAAIFGVRMGDRVTLEILDPAGATILRQGYTAARTQAQQVPYLARRRADSAVWPPGRYRGRVTIERPIDGRPVRQTREAAVELR